MLGKKEVTATLIHGKLVDGKFNNTGSLII